MPPINKDHANRIARMLAAEISDGGKHEIVKVYHGRELVARFNIRRASSRDTSHSDIPAQIHVSAKQALDLANCPLSRDEWVEILRAKGLIDGGSRPG